jgi:hypothetical protein
MVGWIWLFRSGAAKAVMPYALVVIGLLLIVESLPRVLTRPQREPLAVPVSQVSDQHPDWLTVTGGGLYRVDAPIKKTLGRRVA